MGNRSNSKARLSTALSASDDPAFLRMIWALNALQTGRETEASRFFDGYPPEAATDGILGPHAIYPWELETLVNELLTTEKRHYQTFQYRNWNAICGLVNHLREIDNAEYAAQRDQVNIFVEIGRIGARQFAWQRGFVGIPQLYRNAFIYGQGECARFLEQEAQLTPSDMALVGFSLLAVFYPEPAIRPATDMALIHQLGISPEKFHRVLNLISRPIADLRQAAANLRNVDTTTSYKPSILRQFPCVRVGHRGRFLMSPLPDLIMDRVTNGLYYDVIGGDGSVRAEIGQRFEGYCLDLLSSMLPNAHFAQESNYKTSLGKIATPDILMRDHSGGVLLAIECKASRMGVIARFGENPELDRGYEEIAKGVMQLWRYFGHCRQGLAPDRLAIDVQGMILTMDEWFAGRSTVIPQILARANEFADSSAHSIPLSDRIPVAFCTISELESTLKTATPESFQAAVRIGSGEKAGYIFSDLHRSTQAEKTTPKAYPFQDSLRDLLPWYGQLDELRE